MQSIRAARLLSRFLPVVLAISASSMVPSTSVQAQSLDWVRQFGTNVADSAAGVAADSSGVYVVGSTFGTFPGQSYAGLSDVYLQKFDLNGAVVWTRGFGAGNNDVGQGVAADVTGIYIVGSVVGTLPGQTPAGFTDAFVRKYDANGTELWTRQFGSTNFGTDEALGVAVDATGVYVVGRTNGALPGQTQSASSGDDAFIRKYDFNGTEQWTRQFGTSGQDHARAVSADTSGVYVAGFTNGALAGQTAAGNFDAFVRKYNSSGTEQWTRQFGSNQDDTAYAVAVASSGVYVGGYSMGAFPGQTAVARRDAYVRKYDTSGAEQWTRQFGTTADESVWGLDADSSGVYLGGYTSGALPGQTSAGGTDAFARIYDPNGVERGTRQVGSTGADEATGIAVTGGVIYAAGFAGGALPGQAALGNSDAFAVRVSAAVPGVLSVGPESLSVSALQGSGTFRRAIQISASGAAVSWTVTSRVLNGTGWLTVSPPSGTAAPSQPSSVTAMVNFSAFPAAGVYQAAIVVRDAGSSASVILPVTVTVNAPVPRLQLGQSSFLFRAKEGGDAPSSQRLRISNGGTGTLSWSIPTNTTSPQNWLRFSAQAGTTGANQRDFVAVSIVQDGLSAGVYQALVPVTASGAANGLQLLTVTLHVVPAATTPAADLDPSGFVFLAAQGGAAPAADSLTVSNGGGSSLSFQWQATTASGGNWLSVSPPTGSTTQGPATLQVSANSATLKTGFYRGTLHGTFTPGGTQDVDVVLVVAPAGTVLQRDNVRGADCAPQGMDLISTSVTNGSVMPVSFPRTLLVTVLDSCGAPVNDANVLAAVDGRSIVLNSVGNGAYTGNWVPERESASVPLVFSAFHADFATVQRTLTVSTAAAAANTTLPYLLPDGVVEGAAFTPHRPLAPGGIVSLFGSHFAASDTFASGLPLNPNLGGVSVRVGADNAPLIYAGPGQINAQVPYSAQPGESVSVAVNSGGRFTAPQSYLVAPVQPSVFIGGDYAAVLDSQSRAITASNPARIGDTLQIFTTGLGATDPPAVTGAGGPSFSTALLPVTATIGGVDAPVVYQGLAPGFVGLYQVNIVVPSTVASGDAVPLLIRQNGIESNPNRSTNLPVRAK